MSLGILGVWNFGPARPDNVPTQSVPAMPGIFRQAANAAARNSRASGNAVQFRSGRATVIGKASRKPLPGDAGTAGPGREGRPGRFK